jgi:Inner membrane component of T3SS, cytoplasmic domain
MENDDKKIVISMEDLESSVNQERVQKMQDAQKVSLVRPVGLPTQQRSVSGAIPILILSGAGIVGGLFAFVISHFTLSLLQNSQASSTESNLAFSFILAFFIGICVAIADAASSRVIEKIGIAIAIAIPTALVSGLAIGDLANIFYQHAENPIIIKYLQIYNSGQTQLASQYYSNQTHIPRGIAWLIIGIATGLTVGIASRSLKRLALTVVGGAIGGFIGGAIFDFFPANLEWVSQMLGITITGLLIGLSMGLLEQAARTQWIEIVAGGMAGKQFILYKSDITIGSSPSADITLIKDPGISPVHARISAQGGRSYIESLDATRPVLIDGYVSGKSPISDGANITVGGTMIRFRERKGETQIQGNIGTLQ